MRSKTQEQIVFNGASILQAAFTAATTDICTSAAHGFVGGEKVILTTTGTLPAGLALATNYYVRDVTTNTFKLSATPDGEAVNITDTGSGTHTMTVQGKAIYVGDYNRVGISLAFTTTPTMTVKIQGSLMDEGSALDFSAAQSASNRWDYVDIADLQNEASIDGDTGVACSGSADYRLFRASCECLKWICVNVTAFTAGKLDLRIVGIED
jgi:hypothetical protein